MRIVSWSPECLLREEAVSGEAALKCVCPIACDVPHFILEGRIAEHHHCCFPGFTSLWQVNKSIKGQDRWRFPFHLWVLAYWRMQQRTSWVVLSHPTEKIDKTWTGDCLAFLPFHTWGELSGGGQACLGFCELSWGSSLRLLCNLPLRGRAAVPVCCQGTTLKCASGFLSPLKQCSFSNYWS